MIVNGESIKLTDPHRHKYMSAMAEYLSTKDWDCADRDSGDCECPTGSFAQFGRRILLGDAQGFVWHETYGDAFGAEQVFNALDLYYCVWASDDCDNEDRPHYDDHEALQAWDDERQVLLLQADMYISYVVTTESKALVAFSFDEWVAFGEPTGYPG